MSWYVWKWDIHSNQRRFSEDVMMTNRGGFWDIQFSDTPNQSTTTWMWSQTSPVYFIPPKGLNQTWIFFFTNHELKVLTPKTNLRMSVHSWAYFKLFILSRWVQINQILWLLHCLCFLFSLLPSILDSTLSLAEAVHRMKFALLLCADWIRSQSYFW